MPEIRADRMTISMGPQHPSTHGVFRLEIVTDGEIITDARPHIGYLHRCFEKHAEKISYTGVIPFTDRLDYLASMNQNFGFVLAVEKMMGLEIPERAEHLRVIMAELNRMASHLMMIGHFGTDAGAVTPVLYGFRDREYILDLLEDASGARLLYNYYRVGGVAADLPAGFDAKARKFLDYVGPVLDDFEALLGYNKIFLGRTCGVGVIPKDVALSYAVSGPNLRASGVRWDLRRDEPYSVYPKLEFDVPVGRDGPGVVGDAWNRYWVRVQEIRQSARIVRQALEGLPEGDFLKAPKGIRPPKGSEIYFRTETPRGELGYYVISDGTMTPFRVKVRSPGFVHIGAIPAFCTNIMVADLVMAMGTLDFVMGEVDR
jgi:NADH-quinone oxidoreductase subunit D